MSSEHYDPANPIDAEFREQSYELLAAAARQIVRGASWDAFRTWMIDAGASIAPRFVAQAETPEVARAFLGSFARLVWNRTPQPAHGYRIQTLPKPERNAPCPCGSGIKYKHCCGPRETAEAAPPISMLPFVLDCLSIEELRRLPRARFNLEELASAAADWLDDGDVARAIALLEPVFADVATLDDRAEMAFDVLCAAYDEADKPRKKRQLVDAVLAAPNRWLRATAMHREVAILSDRGEHDAAWALFRDAQRTAPEHPALASLEVTVLMGEGKRAQAQERARFWAARLARDDDPAAAPTVEFLREFVRDPDEAMLGITGERFPALAELRALVALPPPPEAHYRWSSDPEGGGLLEPDALLDAVEREWVELFPREEPTLTQIPVNEAPWDDVDAWLPWLRAHPLAWHSFRVLDDLVSALYALPVPGAAARMLWTPLLERGEALLRLTLAQSGGEGGRVPWAWHENRPALRLLVSLVRARAEAGDSDGERALLEWLVLVLNPEDNHGLRHALCRSYFAAGRAADALAVCDRYPDDAVQITFDRVLALFQLGHHDAAQAALADAVRAFPEVLPTLLAAKPRKPKLDPGWVTSGGRDEAWYYREEMREAWQCAGALEWARKARK